MVLLLVEVVVKVLVLVLSLVGVVAVVLVEGGERFHLLATTPTTLAALYQDYQHRDQGHDPLHLYDYHCYPVRLLTIDY